MRKVITIAREFGAGGGEIGRKVAKELGIQFYDKDIIENALANRNWTRKMCADGMRECQVPLDLHRVCLTSTISRLDERLWQAQRMRSVMNGKP